MASTAAAAAPASSSSWCTGCAAYKAATSCCGKCGAAWYCSKDCQVQDWEAGHKKDCKKALLYKLEQLPPDVLRVASAERVTKWVTALKLPHHAAGAPQRKAALDELLLTVWEQEKSTIGRLGLLPGLAHILRGLGNDDEETIDWTIRLLGQVIPENQLTASLFYKCGGTQELARLLFAPDATAVKKKTAGDREGRILSTLRAALQEARDHIIVGNTLLAYSPQEVLVPVLLRLLDPTNDDTAPPKASKVSWDSNLIRHHDAANLLALCITLSAHVPVEVWQEGFRVVAQVVRHYLEPSKNGKNGQSYGEVMMRRPTWIRDPERQRDMMDAMAMQAALREMLIDLSDLVGGFVEHFPQAVELLVPLGLPTVLGLLLGFDCDQMDMGVYAGVQQKAFFLARRCLMFAGSLDTVNALVGANGATIFGKAVQMAECAGDELLAAVAEAPPNNCCGSNSKGKKKEHHHHHHNPNAMSPEKEQEQRTFLKVSLALASDCLKADSHLLEPHLPFLFGALHVVLTNTGQDEEDCVVQRVLAPAVGEALTCVLAALLYLPRTALAPLVATGRLQSNVQSLLRQHQHAPPPSLAAMVLNILGLLATTWSKTNVDDDDDDAPRDIPELLMQVLLNRAGVQDPDVLKEAVLSLQQWVWAAPSTVLPMLRQNEALGAALEALVEAGAVEFTYLATVLQGTADDKTLLTTTPLQTKAWEEHAQLTRSVLEATVTPRLLAFLTVRGEMQCGASGRAFAEGDQVARLTKCMHWFLEEELKNLVTAGAEKEGECYFRYWQREQVELLCPVCARHMRVEIRD